MLKAGPRGGGAAGQISGDQNAKDQSPIEARQDHGAAALPRSPAALLPVYAQFPLHPVAGRGSWLIDEDGAEWLDAYGGHAVSSTGHSHPLVVQAIASQAERLLFYSTAVSLPIREELAGRLVALCPAPLGKVFFCNSGAEANENALHLARKHTGRQLICSLAGGWHGRTVATLAVTDGERYIAAALGAGMPLSRKIPFDDIAGLEGAMDRTVAALILEPVQGMAGARTCSSAFLRAAREICDRVGAVLIFDEVQCGAGRSGRFTAAEALGVTPDIITMAKGLASGLPIGAMVTNDRVSSGISTGDLGSTFGGGPVVCAAALATLDVLEHEGLFENVRSLSQYLSAEARALGSLGVLEVQGLGLLLGLRLNRPAAEVQGALFSKRVITGTATDPAILRLLPPLNFSRREADVLLDALKEVLA